MNIKAIKKNKTKITTPINRERHSRKTKTSSLFCVVQALMVISLDKIPSNTPVGKDDFHLQQVSIENSFLVRGGIYFHIIFLVWWFCLV